MSDFNFSEFVRNVAARGERARGAAAHALDEFGEVVLNSAQEIAPRGGPPTTPRDPAPGTLQESGTAEPAVVSGDTITKTIGFNTEYAAVQHEDMEFAHNDPGQAKYLEIPMRSSESRMGPFIASRVKPAIEQ